MEGIISRLIQNQHNNESLSCFWAAWGWKSCSQCVIKHVCVIQTWANITSPWVYLIFFGENENCDEKKKKRSFPLLNFITLPYISVFHPSNVSRSETTVLSHHVLLWGACAERWCEQSIFTPSLWVKEWCHCGGSRSSAPPALRSSADRWADGVEGRCCHSSRIQKLELTWEPELVSSLFKTKPACSTAELLSSVHFFPLCASSRLCTKAIMHSSGVPRLQRACCGSVWIFISLSRPAASDFSACFSFFSLSVPGVLSVSYRFLLSLLLASSSCCAPVLVELNQTLATDGRTPPPWPVEKNLS